MSGGELEINLRTDPETWEWYLVELFEVCVVDMLEYQGWGSADRILKFC